jgi:ATP-binding cassette subfamily F protein 3
LFTGDDVYKQVAMLSGGEKNKLALARMIVEPCNLLILDEPTNHLDITSCETLTTMLAEYAGTLLLVSHDRYLLNAVTTKTLALSGQGRATFVEGNYAAWREMQMALITPTSKNGQRAKKASSSPTASKSPEFPKAGVGQSPDMSIQNGNTPAAIPAGMNFRELSKARTKARETVAKAEAVVQRLEDRLAEAEAGLAQTGGTVQNLVSLAAEHTRIQDDLATALAQWELAVAEQEALGV